MFNPRDPLVVASSCFRGKILALKGGLADFAPEKDCVVAGHSLRELVG